MIVRSANEAVPTKTSRARSEIIHFARLAPSPGLLVQRLCRAETRRSPGCFRWEYPVLAAATSLEVHNRREQRPARPIQAS